MVSTEQGTVMLSSEEINFDLMMEALEYGSDAHAIKDTDSMDAEGFRGHEQTRQNIIAASKIWKKKRTAVESGSYNPTKKDLLLLFTTRHCFDLYTQGGLNNESEEELASRLSKVQQTSEYLRINTERFNPPAEPTDAGWLALHAAAAQGLLVAKHRRLEDAASVDFMETGALKQTEVDKEEGWRSDALRLADTMKWWRANASSIASGTFVPRLTDRVPIKLAHSVFPKHIETLRDEHAARTASEGKGKGKAVPRSSLKLTGKAGDEQTELEGFIEKLESYLTTIDTFTADTAASVDRGREGKILAKDLEQYFTSLVADTEGDTASLNVYLEGYAGRISKGSLYEGILTGHEMSEEHRGSLADIKDVIDTRLALAMSMSTGNDVQDGYHEDPISTEAASLIDKLITLCDAKPGTASDLKEEPSYRQKRPPRDSSGDEDNAGAEPPQTINVDTRVGSSGSSSSKRGRVR